LARLASADRQALIVVGRSAAELAKLAAELRPQGCEVYCLEIDLAQHDATEKIATWLSQRRFYCDVLVNSAGFGALGPLAEADPATQLQLVKVNVEAPLALSLRFLPGMIQRGRGGIIYVGSITGYAPGPFMSAYCASKAFIRSFSTALASELAGSGVTVTCLTPGVVKTQFFNRAPMGSSRLIKILPRGDAVEAAQAAWSAFRQGKSIVVPRLIDRFIIGLCWMIPDSLLARLVRRLNVPISTTAKSE
jgi:short-subunit dehydrogenase